MKKIIFALLLFSIFFIPQSSYPCTTFCLEGNQLVVGSNLDWFLDDSLVIVNKRNVSKTALLNPDGGDEQPARWTSKYGSITFNIGGRELPFGGINEAGLVVTSASLEPTEFPKPDPRPAIFNVQWKQYQLDNFTTVEEVISSDSQIRITPNSPMRSHFLVSDRMGNCAVIEYINGKMVYYFKETMPVKTLANSTYAESIEYWEKNQAPTTDPYLSVWRFITSADMVKAYDPTNSKPAIDYAFETLSKVSLGTIEEIDGVVIRSPVATVLSIAYDKKNLRVYFRTFKNKKIRYFNMNSFDFSCKTPVKVLDIHGDHSGDVSSKFINYTYKINRDLVGKTIHQPDKVLDDIAKYPETAVCTE